MEFKLKASDKKKHFCFFSKIPLWIRKYFIALFGIWTIFLIFRLIFFLWFIQDLQPGANYIYALYLGAKFDLRVATLGALPLLFIFGLKQKYPNLFSTIVSVCYSIVLSLVSLVHIADIYHYEYLRKRINASVADFIPDMHDSLHMVWQTYPVIRIVLILILLFLIFCVLFKYLLNYTSYSDSISYTSKESKHPRLKRAGSMFLVFLISACFIYGQISAYPLRWSNAYFSTNNFTSNLALNPVLNLYETTKFSLSSPYSEKEVRKYYQVVKDYLKLDHLGVDTDNFKFKRVVPESLEAPARGYNVILIIMESLAWNKLSWNLKDINPTPNLTKIMSKSTVFSSFFSPAVGTARGVFATVTSIPDVTSLKSSSRNPAVIDQDVIINHMEGYEKFYFLGGSANWGNIRGILQNNIRDLKIYEEGSYSKDSHRVDVWGIPDLDLFNEAARVLKTHKLNSDKPFFSLIQTSSYHRPYTIPEHRGDFKLENVDNETLLKNSFISLDEYNSLRFADYSVGVFFNKLKELGLEENTLVAIIGDHGLSAPRADTMPPGYQYYNLIHHQIPLILYAPSILKHEILSQAGTQVDVMPTIAGLMGLGYIIRFSLPDPAFDNSIENNQDKKINKIV